MYDCRRTPDSQLTMTDVYDATIDQAVLADQLGFDHVWFTEHHFLADGYLPSFQPLAGAIAARTEQIRISTDIALLPLYHPIRLAEELAILDHISHGRMEFGIGMGYVPKEFEASWRPAEEPGIDDRRGHPDTATCVGGRSVQFPRQALPAQQHRGTPQASPGWRSPIMDCGHEHRRSNACRPLLDEPATSGRSSLRCSGRTSRPSRIRQTAGSASFDRSTSATTENETGP